jgi:type IV pilus assembly protein PilE
MPNSVQRAGSDDGTRSGITRSRARAGFTLVDVVAALAIAALLACVAVPSFRAQATRARRSDARAALLSLAAAEEGFRTSCNAYAAFLDDSRETSCAALSLKFRSLVGAQTYSLEVLSADAAGWTAVATAIPGGPQEADLRCHVLGLTSTGTRSAAMADGTPNDEECWTR